MSSAKKFVLSFLVCLLVFSILGNVAYKYFDNALFGTGEGEIPSGDDQYTDIPKSDTSVTETGDKGTVSALILGKDLSTNEIDAIIIVKADKALKKIAVSSIPTESRYAVTGTDSKGNYYSGSMSFKETYNAYGIDYLVKKIYALTDVKADYYAIVNSHAAQTIINELCGNGIRYTVPEKMEYTDTVRGADIDLYEGDQYLNGTKAVQLLRFRDYKSGNGDVKRCTTQIEFIREILGVMNAENPLKAKLDDAKSTKLLSYLITNATAKDVSENLDMLFNLSEYTFVSVPFRYSALIKAEHVSSLHADFNSPFSGQ